jgi:hypothetical protein
VMRKTFKLTIAAVIGSFMIRIAIKTTPTAHSKF